jgi:hypothetical protein
MAQSQGFDLIRMLKEVSTMGEHLDKAWKDPLMRQLVQGVGHKLAPQLDHFRQMSTEDLANEAQSMLDKVLTDKANASNAQLERFLKLLQLYQRMGGSLPGGLKVDTKSWQKNKDSAMSMLRTYLQKPEHVKIMRSMLTKFIGMLKEADAMFNKTNGDKPELKKEESKKARFPVSLF